MSRNPFLLLALLMTGCQPSPGTSDQRVAHPAETEANIPAAASVANNSPLATYWLPPQKDGSAPATSPTAAISGILALRDGCLVVHGSGDFYQPLFNAQDAHWDPEKQMLFLQSKAFPLGADMYLGGGGVNDVEGLKREINTRIPPCNNAPVFMVFFVTMAHATTTQASITGATNIVP